MTTERNVMPATVVLIAATNLYRDAIAERIPYVEHGFSASLDAETVLAVDELAEIAARTCRATLRGPKDISNRKLVGDLAMSEVESVFEHASATFYVDDIAHSTAYALRRHRELAISERALRHATRVNADWGWIGASPILREDYERMDALNEHFDRSLQEAHKTVSAVREQGYSETEAHQAATAFLPMCTDTSLIVSGTIAAWRRVLAASLLPTADADVREVAQGVLKELRRIAPHSVQWFLPHR